MTAGFGAGANGPLLIAVDMSKKPAKPDAAAPPSPDGQPAGPATDPRLKTCSDDLDEHEGRGDPSPSRSSTTPATAAVMTVTPTTAPSAQATETLVDTLRDDVIPTGDEGPGHDRRRRRHDRRLHRPRRPDLQQAPAGDIAVVVLLSFVLLTLAFRSLLVPLKAVVMNLLSIGAAFGIVTFVFEPRLGGAARRARRRRSPIVSLRPADDVRDPVRALDGLRGLPDDPRPGGAGSATGDPARRSSTASPNTGRVITSAALIMVSVFCAFIINGDPNIKQFGRRHGARGRGRRDGRALPARARRHVAARRRGWWLPGLARPAPAALLDRGRGVLRRAGPQGAALLRRACAGPRRRVGAARPVERRGRVADGASSARTDGRAASAARVAAKIVRSDAPSAIGAHRDAGVRLGPHELGQQRHGLARGDEREADDRVVRAVADVGVEARRARGTCARVISSQPMPGWPVAHASPASSASGTGRRVAPRRRVARGQHDAAPGRDAGPRARRRPGAAAAGAATRRRARGRRRRARARAATARARPRRARSAGRARRARAPRIAGTASRSATDWNDAIARPPGDACPAAAASSASASSRALEQRLGVADEHERRRRSAARRGRPARAAARPASRSSTASCWETADGVNCSASATAAIVPRSCSSRSRRRRRRSSIVSNATESSYRNRIASDASLRHDASRHARSRRPPLPRLRRRVRRDGRSSASSPTTRARPSARCWPCASRSPPSLFWALAGLAHAAALRAACARCRAATCALALALGAVGYSAQAGAYFAALERLDASLLVAAPLHVPGDRHGRRDRARPRARSAARTAAALALASARPRARAGRRRGRRARPARRRRSGSAAAVVYSAYILVSRGRRRARRRRCRSARSCAPAPAATLTLGGARRAATSTRAPSAPTGCGWLAAIARRLDGRRRSASSSPACGASARRRRRSSRRRAGGHGRARVRRLRRVAAARCSSPAARSCSAACSWSARRSADGARPESRRHRPRP